VHETVCHVVRLGLNQHSTAVQLVFVSVKCCDLTDTNYCLSLHVFYIGHVLFALLKIYFCIHACMYVCMGIDPWVDSGTCPPYFLKWRGRPVFCLPYFFGSRHCLLFEKLLNLTVTPCIIIIMIMIDSCVLRQCRWVGCGSWPLVKPTPRADALSFRHDAASWRRHRRRDAGTDLHRVRWWMSARRWTSVQLQLTRLATCLGPI